MIDVDIVWRVTLMDKYTLKIEGNVIMTLPFLWGGNKETIALDASFLMANTGLSEHLATRGMNDDNL